MTVSKRSKEKNTTLWFTRKILSRSVLLMFSHLSLAIPCPMPMSKLFPDVAINHHDRFRQIMSNLLGLEPVFLGAEAPIEAFSHL